jgi:hypothetical protein
MGYGPLPENSGREMGLSGTAIFTLNKEGKIIREVGEEGALTGMQQLGLLPQPSDGRKLFFDSEEQSQ